MGRNLRIWINSYLNTTFTSTLLMMLVEDKTILLDDPAEKYVPEVARIIGYLK